MSTYISISTNPVTIGGNGLVADIHTDRNFEDLYIAVTYGNSRTSPLIDSSWTGALGIDGSAFLDKMVSPTDCNNFYVWGFARYINQFGELVDEYSDFVKVNVNPVRSKLFVNDTELGNIGSAATVRVGGTVTVKSQNAASGQLFDIVYLRYSDTERDEIGRISLGNGKEGSFSWTVPEKARTYFQGKTGRDFTVEVETHYRGYSEKIVGTDSFVITISVSSSALVPVIHSVECTPYTETAGYFSWAAYTYVMGVGKAYMSVSADCDNDRISEYRYQIAGITTVSEDAQAYLSLPVSGYTDITVTAVSSSGFTASKTVTIYIEPYAEPKIIPYRGYSSILVQRVNNDGIPDETGDRVRILAGARFSSVDGNNRVNMFIRIRQTDGSWQQSQYPLSEAKTDPYYSGIPFTNISPSLSYIVQIRVTDRFRDSTMEFKISTAPVSFSLMCAHKGAAFGKKAEFENCVEIAENMKLLVNGTVDVAAPVWNEVTAWSDTDSWPASDAKGLKGSGIWYCAENGNHIHVSFCVGYNTNKSTFGINSTMIPEAYRPKRPVYAICPDDKGWTKCCVDENGKIRIEGYSESGRHEWLDGHIDYFLEGS